MILKGRVIATDDVDLGGHHLRDWRYLTDIPRGGATTDQALVWDGTAWTPTTLSLTVSGTVAWDDVQGKPSTFPPSSHTHVSGDITNWVTGGTGITVTANNTVAVALTAGTNIEISGATIATTSTPVFSMITEGATALSSKYSAISHTHVTTFCVNVVFNGAGVTVAVTGSEGAFRLPTACTLVKASVVADASGSMSVALKKTTYSGYAGSLSDITGGSDLDLSSAIKMEDSTLSGWTTSYSAGDVVTYAITGTPSTVTWATMTLFFTKVI